MREKIKEQFNIKDIVFLVIVIIPMLFLGYQVKKASPIKGSSTPIIYSVDNQDSYVIGTVESKYRFDEDNYVMVLDGGRMYKITFQQYEQIKTGDKVFSYIKESSEE